MKTTKNRQNDYVWTFQRFFSVRNICFEKVILAINQNAREKFYCKNHQNLTDFKFLKAVEKAEEIQDYS